MLNEQDQHLFLGPGFNPELQSTKNKEHNDTQMHFQGTQPRHFQSFLPGTKLSLNRPFYSSMFSDLAFERQRGWR